MALSDQLTKMAAKAKEAESRAAAAQAKAKADLEQVRSTHAHAVICNRNGSSPLVESGSPPISAHSRARPCVGQNPARAMRRAVYVR